MSGRAAHPARLAAALATLGLCACGPAAEAPAPAAPAAPEAARGAPNAHHDLVALLREDLAAVRHPADGGGRAWLEDAAEGERPRHVAGAAGRFPLLYEAGPLGIAVGGALYLQISPYWDWSPAQLEVPEAPGYTTVSTEAEGVELVPVSLEPELLAIEVRGRALRAGERVRIEYGAGPAGARVDRFAERGAEIALAVDGDGDGVRQRLAEAPLVDITAGPAAQLVAHLPASARPGESIELVVAALDAEANAGVELAGTLHLTLPAGLEGPETVELAPAAGGVARIALQASATGVQRLLVEGPQGLVAESNPLRVDAELPRVLFGDLHGHTAWSDGTGLPEDWYAYARDVAALDVAALTDHDHWGPVFLDAEPARWNAIGALVTRFHVPGRFVALRGFEWTNWLYGHRHVLHFDDDGPLISSIDPATDEPEELWAALRGRPALTLAHHSAGAPVAIDWRIPPDPVLEPVTEVVSVHGSSEAADAPLPVQGAIPGNFVRDALARGYRLGFVGSGDGHDGHPGLAHAIAPVGGLAGILAPERTREAVLEALRARRVYATSGPRIVLDVRLAGRPMGARVPPGDAPMQVVAAAPAPLRRLELIRPSGPISELDLEGRREIALEADLTGLVQGEFLYVRLVQEDGHAAWSSPFFVDAEAR